MEEAVSGVKGELAVKIIGDDLKTLEAKADEIVNVMQPIPGIADLGVFRVLGQPNLNLIVDRAKADRYAINVADIQDAIETAVGGKAVSEVLIGEEHYDLVVRYQAPYRTTVEDIANIRILAPSGERVSLGQLCDVRIEDGASMIYREDNSRYIAIKYSVRGRDLGSTVRDAIHDVSQKVKLPTGYTLEWAGEYASQQRANARLALIVPITVLLIVLLLYTAFGSFNWSLLIMATLATAPIGGMLALLVTGTHFSVSSGIGMLALFGVSVQVGLIMIQYINQARVGEPDIMKADRGRRRPQPAADSDGHAGRHPGPASRRPLPRYRLGLPAALRHRHRGRPYHRPFPQRHSPPHTLLPDRPPGRQNRGQVRNSVLSAALRITSCAWRAEENDECPAKTLSTRNRGHPSKFVCPKRWCCLRAYGGRDGTHWRGLRPCHYRGIRRS